MKLNCKAGDLAVVVAPGDGSQCAATGKFVEVLQLVDGEFRTPDGIVLRPMWDGAPRSEWVVKYQRPAPQVSLDGLVVTSLYDFMPDSRLRPIRDQPGEDETILWAGLPAGHEVAA